MYVVQHPQHGISVRTTPRYPTGTVPEGREPEGWSETRVRSLRRPYARLRNTDLHKTRILELATALYNAHHGSHAHIASPHARIAQASLRLPNWTADLSGSGPNRSRNRVGLPSGRSNPRKARL